MDSNRILTFVASAIVMGLIWGHLYTNSQVDELRASSDIFTSKLTDVSSVSSNNKKALVNLDEVYLEQQKALSDRLKELEYLIEAQASAQLALADENQQFRQFLIKTCGFVTSNEEYQRYFGSTCKDFLTQFSDCSGRSLNDLILNNHDVSGAQVKQDNYNLFRCEH